jgi:hypothetical protein
MSSPFPGMDPYLENPAKWPSFHNSFVPRLSDALNRDPPQGYYAQIDLRKEVGLAFGEPTKEIRPDIEILQSPNASGTAVADRQTLPVPSPSLQLVLDSEAAELAFLEIRDATADHEVVTLIELLSPSNKRAGEDRRQYLAKRAAVLRSPTSLIEIDLLRKGRRLWRTRYGVTDLRSLDPPPEYLITVSRAWKRESPFRIEVFPAFLREPLPVITVPLRQGEAEVPLDLQRCFTEHYDAGPYRRGAVDYTRPPEPPLPEEHREWAAACISAWLAAR